MWILGIDQYGQRHELGAVKHVRKALCEHLGRKHCVKMYHDTVGGKTEHVGYVIAGLWITLYVVTPWTK